MKTKSTPKPLYDKDGNEVWDAKEYLRTMVMTDSEEFWFATVTGVVSGIVFAGILLLIKYFSV